MIKHSLKHEVVKVKHEDCGNFIIVVCKIGAQSYLFANVYGPNDDEPNFYRNLISLLESFQTDHVIVGGDFNFVVNPDVDSYNYAREYNINAKKTFLKFTDQNDLIDIWRLKNPTKLEYTWSRNNPLKCGRLDMFFVDTSLSSRTKEVIIKPGYRTDHCLLIMKIQNKELDRGPGLWKMNDSVLQDSEYIDIINNIIKDTVVQYAIPVYTEEYITNTDNYVNVQFTIKDSLFYEVLLMLIRGETVRYCKRKARTQRQKENELLDNIQSAQLLFNQNICNENAEGLHEAKEKLEKHRKPYIEGLIVRSRVQWHEEGEKSSKYFLTLEKRNAARKSIQYIENENKILTSSNAILSLFTETLQRKYSVQDESEPDINYLKANIAERLTGNEKSELDADLSLQELTIALYSMKKGKTPGSNGFSVIFFRCFWKSLGVFLFRALKLSLLKGTLLQSHQESIITLIPKTGRPSQSLKGWRPISLLNVDYKIISTAIANRLKSVIGRIISPSQSAYIKGRYIGENSRLVYDIISHINQTRQSGCIMAADFEAAFETVSWPYLRAVLGELNFGHNFMKMINTMFLNRQNFSRIMLNGFLGEKIFLSKGIRQGDPVSGLLFNIAVEVLAGQISKSNKVIGLKINNNTEIRISQYADDTILFPEDAGRSINGAIEELTEFSTHSGLKLNWEKTSCLSLGSLSPPEVTENIIARKIKWVEEIKILGIYFKNDMSNITDRNLEKRIAILESEIAQWQRRHITPLGKITVIKSLLLSKFVHLFLALPNPSEKCVKSIEQKLFKFLWHNKPDRIKRMKVIQKYEYDGLEMVHLPSFIKSLKLSWIKRLINSTGIWTSMARLEQIDPFNLLTNGVGQLTLKMRKIKNKFWKEVIKSLIHVYKLIKLKDEEILREKIWFSDYTKFRTSKVSQWDNRGLRFIGDLFNPNGNIMTREEIKQQYRISMTFLCYKSLILSLPHSIRNATNISFQRPNIPFKLQLFINKINLGRYCYWLFVNELRSKYSLADSNLQQKWNRDIEYYYQGSLVNVKKTTKSTYLLYLHYKIITRTVTTKKFLHIIKISDSNTCTFCSSAIETICHLFWECPVTQTFIQNISREIANKYRISFQYNKRSWFFLNDTDELQTLLITLTKAVIYKAWNNDEKPSLSHMMNSLRSEVQKEMYVSREKNKEEVFENKWKTLKNILQ